MVQRLVESSKNDLDRIDRRILDELQDDGRLTNAELAARVGLSESPCFRRVRRLERDGFITGYRAEVSREKLGLGLTVFVGVKVERHTDEEVAAFERWAREQPEVMSCHLVSGEVDYLLQVTASGLPAYEQFLARLLKLPSIKDIRSTIAIREVKSNARVVRAV